MVVPSSAVTTEADRQQGRRVQLDRRQLRSRLRRNSRNSEHIHILSPAVKKYIVAVLTQ